ncbi:MAG: hypothetical protein AB7G06_03605 [Bdellovibrionales bacterium]
MAYLRTKLTDDILAGGLPPLPPRGGDGGRGEGPRKPNRDNDDYDERWIRWELTKLVVGGSAVVLVIAGGVHWVGEQLWFQDMFQPSVMDIVSSDTATTTSRPLPDCSVDEIGCWRRYAPY